MFSPPPNGMELVKKEGKDWLCVCGHMMSVHDKERGCLVPGPHRLYFCGCDFYFPPRKRSPRGKNLFHSASPGNDMLRVTVELVPRGDESRAKKLCVGVIFNDITGTLTSGNYGVKLSRQGIGEKTFETRTPWRQGRVTGFPRKRLNSWDLLYRALQSTVGERSPSKRKRRRQ